MTSKRDLQVVVSAKDEASAKIAKMGATIKETLKKTAVAAGVATAALTAGIKTAIEAYGQQEAAETRLMQLGMEVAKMSGEQVKALKEQAAALQEVGVIGDEVTMVGQSQLASFQLTSDQVQLLTPRLLDLAVANKGVGASANDLQTISNQLGKAIATGIIGPLADSGIVMTEAQKAAFELADQQGRVALMAEILDGNYKGLNESMAQTSQGGIQQLKNSFGDLMEQIGGTLIPVLTMLIQEIKPLLQTTMDWISNNKELTAKIIMLLGAILPILTILPLLISGIQMLGTALLFLATNPIGIVITTIGLLVAALIWLWNNSDIARQKLLDAWNLIVSGVKIYVGSLVAVIKALAIGVIEIVSGFMTFIKEAIETGMEFIKGIWEGAWGAISEFASNVLDNIGGFVDGIITRISNAIGKIKEFLGLSNEASGSASGVTRRASTITKKGAPLHSATGGNVFSGQTSIVGENGPELVTFGRTGTVIPNNRIGGGGTTVNVYVSGNTLLSDNNELGERIGDMIINQLRLQTRLS